ncbi:MAG TPA: cupin domain-containing protein [Gaiellales bacterium]
MRSVNILEAGLDRQVGSAIGSQQMGAFLYELADGQRSHPYHFHHDVEEWLVVLAGTPRVRTAAGERTLVRGDVVCFPHGPAGLHEISGPATILIITEQPEIDAVEYPESRTLELRPFGRVFRNTDPSPTAEAHPLDPVNLYEIALEQDPNQPSPFLHRATRLGPPLGAVRLGGAVYEIAPGNANWPYHYEGVEEEWLLVLTGVATLRDPEGEHELQAGALVCFTPGPDGGHQVRNRSDEPVRIAMFSTMPPNTLSICVYPDSSKMSVHPWPGTRQRLGDEVGYWDGEL